MEVFAKSGVDLLTLIFARVRHTFGILATFNPISHAVFFSDFGMGAFFVP